MVALVRLVYPLLNIEEMGLTEFEVGTPITERAVGPSSGHQNNPVNPHDIIQTGGRRQ